MEEVIENPILSYIEPYASSASEMIAEVLQYFADKININPTEAERLRDIVTCVHFERTGQYDFGSYKT